MSLSRVERRMGLAPDRPARVQVPDRHLATGERQQELAT